MRTSTAEKPERLARHRGVSLHRQIYLVLRDEIRQGVYYPGDVLPSEDEIAKRFGVSRVTLRTALAALATDALIERRQGKGTFVREAVAAEPLRSTMADLLTHMRDVSTHTEVKVLQFDYVNAPASTGLESLGKSALYQRAVRVRSRAGRPLFHITTYIPEEIGRTFSRRELGTTPLYDLMQRAKVTFHSGDQVVSAAVADPKVAARLDLAVGDPLVVVKRRHFDREGRLVEYLEMLASPSVFELQMSLAPAEL